MGTAAALFDQLVPNKLYNATGIGVWTEDVFVKAIRTGKHLGVDNGRSILPPMPWEEIAQWKDNDLRAVYRYLRSLPPIRNQVPAPVSPQDAAKYTKVISTSSEAMPGPAHRIASNLNKLI